MRIQEKHIDSGDHANWLAQLAIAQECHFALRDELGFGLDQLKEHGLFLVMRKVSDVEYLSQLRLGDEIDVATTVLLERRIGLDFSCEFKLGGEVVTRMKWFMPLINQVTNSVARIPPWIMEKVNS